MLRCKLVQISREWTNVWFKSQFENFRFPKLIPKFNILSSDFVTLNLLRWWEEECRHSWNLLTSKQQEGISSAAILVAACRSCHCKIFFCWRMWHTLQSDLASNSSPGHHWIWGFLNGHSYYQLRQLTSDARVNSWYLACPSGRWPGLDKEQREDG